MSHIGLFFANPGSYFSLSGDSVTGDESHGETRYATRLEVHAAYHVSLHGWEKGWQPEGRQGNPLKERSADMMLFGLLDLTPKETVTALR